MFGWIKNKVANFSELDTCIAYLEYEIDKVSSIKAIKSITTAIQVGILRINNEGITASQFGNIYKNIKDDVMFKKSLRNCKDIDFATPYIIMAFFHSINFIDTDNGKMAILKILDFLGRCKDDSVKKVLNDIHNLLGIN